MLLSLFPHLCFKVAPWSSCSLIYCASKQHLVLHVVSLIYCASKQHHVFHIVSLISCLFHTSGNFSLQNLACIFLRWASSNALGLVSKQVGCTPTSFLLLSIHSSSASVAWQSLLLMLTSIDGHLHNPLISLVNVRLSPFCLLHTIPIIRFYSTHSAISMAHAHVLPED